MGETNVKEMEEVLVGEGGEKKVGVQEDKS